MSYTKAQAASIQDRADAMTCDEAARDLWLHVGSHYVLETLTADDVHQLGELRSLIERGEIEAAHNYAATFETAVRESIPADVYVFIGGELNIR